MLESCIQSVMATALKAVAAQALGKGSKVKWSLTLASVSMVREPWQQLYVSSSLVLECVLELVMRCWSSRLVILGSSSRTNLLFLSVSLLLLSTLTTICSWGLTSTTTPVLSHLVG